MKVGVQVLLLISFLLTLVFADDSHTKPFKEGEEVIVWVNKVGPFRNPQETYMFYSLPFCKPEKDTETHSEGLGEALQGYELRKSPILVEFKRDTPKKLLCKKTINKEETEQFIEAVKNQYWYQLFIDDLPVWGMVGELVNEGGEEQPYIYTHMKFSFSFNNDRVIEVNLTAENPVPLVRGTQLEFTYSVSWATSNLPFEKRFQKYLDNNFFEHQIHWFSIFNSFMMVIFLTGLVAMILMRTLHKDIARYTKDDEEEGERDVGDESGWKQVHGDVFRSPPYLIFFSALYGTGFQLAVMVSVVILLANFTTWYASRGTTITVFIFLYALSSFIGGYTGGGYYARSEGKNWIRCMLYTAGLFPGVVVSIAFALNFIAIGYGSLAAIPFGTMVVVTLIWCFISFPMTLIGTVIGRNWNGTADNPCRISPVPHPIPEKPWYLHPFVNIILGGVLPFGSIFIEMYFIFTSFWHYKYYYVYGFMLLVYIILMIVSVCVTIVSTYFLLNSEDYRWQWVSFLSSASTAGYVFLYSIYYFFVKTKMNGFFQTCFYFGYVAMFCIGLGILCGAIGFVGTSIFVKKIYQHVKID